MAGVGHLDIGTGVGDASVFNPLPAVQQYGQILQQRQAKHENEVKQLADSLAKGYDPSGLRNDADRSAYIKQYNDVKDFAIGAENEKDATKKAMKLAEVKQKLNDLGAFSAGSKTLDKFERDAAKEHALHPYLYDNDTSKNLLDQRGKVWNDPNNIKDYGGIVRGVDPAKEQAKYQKVRTDILKDHPATYGVETVGPESTIEGKKSRQATSNRIIPYQDALEHNLHATTADLDHQKYLNDKYPDIQDPDPQKQLALRVAQEMHDNGDSNGVYDKPKIRTVTAQLPQRFSAEQLWFLKHYGVPYNPNPPGQAVSNQPTPAQTLITSMQQGIPGSGEKLVSLAPKGQYGGEKPKIGYDNETSEYDFNFPALIDQKAAEYNRDLKTKFAKLYGKDDYDPTATGFGKLKQEVIAPASRYAINPNSPDYLAQVAQMAKDQNINLTQLNQIEGIKGGHGQVRQAQQQAKPQNYKAINGKSYNHGELLKMGYSEDQIKQAIKLGNLK